MDWPLHCAGERAEMQLDRAVRVRKDVMRSFIVVVVRSFRQRRSTLVWLGNDLDAHRY